MLDVMIVGGGPAGLSAGLVLGRVLRRGLVADAGRPRNAVADAVHGFLSRDNTSPAELYDRARNELGTYPSVELRKVAVESVSTDSEGYETVLSDGSHHHARRLLLATGVTDELPDIDGLADLWGRGVFHCAYCHGWEARDKPLAVLGGDTIAAQLAIYLTRLSADVVLCTNGPPTYEPSLPDLLALCGVQVQQEPVSRVEGTLGNFERVVFDTGDTLARGALFILPPARQRSELPTQLGCTLLDDGKVQVDQNGQTTVAGVYAAGDLCRTPDMQLPASKVITAAAGGSLAAVAIDLDLALTDVGSGRPPGQAAR